MTIAIVTGGGSGLGRAFAEALAATGVDVIVADRDRDAAEQTAACLPTRSEAVTADLSDPASAPRVLAAAERHGGPHVLINNAGGWTPGDRQFPDAAPADWLATVALNLTTPMLLTQLSLDPMRRLGGGAVLNISSSAGVGHGPYGSPEYAATKAALVRFTSASAGLGDSHGVRVTCVVPDWIGLPRAHEEAAGQRLIPPEDVVTVGLGLLRDGVAGTVVEMPR